MRKLHFTAKTHVLITAMFPIVWGLALQISATDDVFLPLVNMQNVISTSYNQFQLIADITGHKSSGTDKDSKQSILSNIEDTLPIQSLRFDFHFNLEYDYIASWLTDEMFGFIEMRKGIFSGLSRAKDDFTINFLNAEGDFQALFSIHIPSLLFSGNYETNITNYPYSAPTPDQDISGQGSYNSSFNLVEFTLQVDGSANPDEPVNISNVSVSFDFTNPTSTFSNLTLKSWSGWGNGDTITWFRMIPKFSDIPKYFSWNLEEFSVFLDFQSIADQVFRCALQNAFKDCTLMDLLVSTDCVNKTMNNECMKTDIFQLIFLDETRPDISLSTLYSLVGNGVRESKDSIGVPNGNIFKYSSSSVDNMHGRVESLAFNFLEHFGYDDGLNLQIPVELRMPSKKTGKLASRLVMETAVGVPSIDVAWRWRSSQPDWVGGTFKAWNSNIVGLNEGLKTISTQFLDERGTFLTTYNITFPYLNMTGNYDTNLIFYNRQPSYIGGWWNLGEGEMYGTGEYHWNLKDAKLNLVARGNAPMNGTVSFSNIVFEMSHGHRTEWLEGATFTNLTNIMTSYFGNISMERHPDNWTQVYPIFSTIIQTFLYDDTSGERNKTFEDVVADQLMCALNHAIQDCNILDLIISDDCLRMERTQSCFDGSEMTIRQPATWSTPVTTENPEISTRSTTHTTQSPTGTNSIGTSTEPTTESVTHNPINFKLLMNQTQVLLDQAKMLLGIVQALV